QERDAANDARDEERKAKEVASEQRKAALNAKGEAQESATEANKQRDSSNRRLYNAHLPMADQARRANEISRARELLSALVPLANQPDLRGWDWHYLQGLCGREQLALGRDHWLGGEGEMVGLVTWSPDGR